MDLVWNTSVKYVQILFIWEGELCKTDLTFIIHKLLIPEKTSIAISRYGPIINMRSKLCLTPTRNRGMHLECVL